jgi:Ca2+-binding EF-hand superfamily protein
MQRFQQWFRSVDRDNSGSISAPELAGIQFGNRPIGAPVAAKLIKVFDKDHSGTVDFNEYVALQRFLEHVSNAFFAADKDRSGTIDAQEILTALGQAGFQLSMPTIQAAVAKFDTTRRGLDFANFLFVCAHLAHCRSIFEWNDTQRTGQIHVGYDAFCHIGIDLI